MPSDAEYYRQYRIKNRERIRERQRRWEASHNRSEYHRQYYLKNKERKLAYKHEQWLANREAHLARQRAWRKKNRWEIKIKDEFGVTIPEARWLALGATIFKKKGDGDDYIELQSQGSTTFAARQHGDHDHLARGDHGEVENSAVPAPAQDQ